MVEGIPEIDQDLCTGCNSCTLECPTGAVGIVNGKAVIINPENCQYCTDCERVCPAGAIKCPFDIVLVAKQS
ncbi:MAG: hypothetical protein A2Z15_01875 [Chloroflexi bacterium RBG_16_50_11]|nr:MAG: hypothetical protein A2Z15_01875 [Chloroflexi bacterium RBG_16_50_11]